MRVDERERDRLERLAASGGHRGTRARIVLLAGAGLSDTAIAAQLGVSRPTVALWRERYAKDAAAALADLPRTGRPAVVRDAVVLAASLTHPPDQPDTARWSARSLAGALGISAFSVRKVWRRWGLVLDGIPTWGTDLPVVGYVREVAGLYLNPPDAALAVRFEGDGYAPRPFRPELTGLVVQRAEPAHRADAGESVRAVLAAIDDARSGVADECFPRQRDRDFVLFLRDVVAAAAGARLAVVVARPQMRGSRLVRGWMADHDAVPVALPPEDVDWAEVLEAMVAASSRANALSAYAAGVTLRERVAEFTALTDRGVDCLSWPYSLG